MKEQNKMPCSNVVLDGGDLLRFAAKLSFCNKTSFVYFCLRKKAHYHAGVANAILLRLGAPNTNCNRLLRCDYLPDWVPPLFNNIQKKKVEYVDLLFLVPKAGLSSCFLQSNLRNSQTNALQKTSVSR